MNSIPDSHSSDRKSDHIQLAFQSAGLSHSLDSRFDYEPLLGKHPDPSEKWPCQIAGKAMDFPIWVSSMTGGTARAGDINRNLAKLCGEFKLGMGLGSCRKIIEDPSCLPDFLVRKWIGDQPLFANLGIAQLEMWVRDQKIHLIQKIVDMTESDGIIIHVNPMQEFLQTEGDRLRVSPIETLRVFMDQVSFPVILKEVGQGMGPASLKEALSLPFASIELAAYGGTNFALLELLREHKEQQDRFLPLATVGHRAEEMISICNEIFESGNYCNTESLILSGGVRNFLDGYYLLSRSKMPSVYGMASEFLKHAVEGYESLQHFFEDHIRGLLISKAYLKLKSRVS